MKNIFADYYVNAKNNKCSITLYFFEIGLGKFDVGYYEKNEIYFVLQKFHFYKFEIS